MLYISK